MSCPCFPDGFIRRRVNDPSSEGPGWVFSENTRTTTSILPKLKLRSIPPGTASADKYRASALGVSQLGGPGEKGHAIVGDHRARYGSDGSPRCFDGTDGESLAHGRQPCPRHPRSFRALRFRSTLSLRGAFHPLEGERRFPRRLHPAELHGGVCNVLPFFRPLRADCECSAICGLEMEEEAVEQDCAHPKSACERRAHGRRTGRRGLTIA